MGDERLERRAVLGAGVGLLAGLAGCSGLFIEEQTPAPGSGGGGGSTPTSTPAPTVSPTAENTPPPTRTNTQTPEPTAVPGDVIEVRNKGLSLRTNEIKTYTFVDYRFTVENVGSRTIDFVEFRVDVRYEYEDVSKIIGSERRRFEFDYPGDEDGNEDEQEGLAADEEDVVGATIRYERDGRADESTDESRFELELSLRWLKYL